MEAPESNYVAICVRAGETWSAAEGSFAVMTTDEPIALVSIVTVYYPELEH